jgi:hypothetical protein
MTGDIDSMALYAGEAVGLVRSRETAASIISELAGGLAPEMRNTGLVQDLDHEIGAIARRKTTHRRQARWIP